MAGRAGQQRRRDYSIRTHGKRYWTPKLPRHTTHGGLYDSPKRPGRGESEGRLRYNRLAARVPPPPHGPFTLHCAPAWPLWAERRPATNTRLPLTVSARLATPTRTGTLHAAASQRRRRLAPRTCTLLRAAESMAPLGCATTPPRRPYYHRPPPNTQPARRSPDAAPPCR